MSIARAIKQLRRHYAALARFLPKASGVHRAAPSTFNSAIIVASCHDLRQDAEAGRVRAAAVRRAGRPRAGARRAVRPPAERREGT